MSDPTATPFATTVEGEDVTVRVPDPEHRHERVALWCDLELGDTRFLSVDQGWELRLPRPPVDRLEYLLDLDGALVVDPTNPLVVPGAFGDHSWVPLAGYRPPAWLDLEPVEAERAEVTLDTGVGPMPVVVWSPAAASAGDRLPLLLAHDGPEMDAYGRLTTYVGALVASGELPPMRVALLPPGPRNARYSANPAYAAALTAEVVPALSSLLPMRGRPVVMGQSLGGLAALHAAWTSPGVFAGLFLQSGSFFTPQTDPQESGFEYWAEVTGFVRTLLDASIAARKAPRMALTCGTAEENYANNLLMREHLERIGVTVTWGEVRDGHTWTCWRDTLDPCLTGLLTTVWA